MAVQRDHRPPRRKTVTRRAIGAVAAASVVLGLTSCYGPPKKVGIDVDMSCMTTHGGTGYFDVGTHTVHIDFTAPEWTDPNGEIQLGEVTISGYDGGFTWDPSTAEVWTTTSGLEDFSQNPDPNTFGEENHFAGPAPHEGTTTSLGKAKATVDGEPGTDATIDIDDVWFFTISQDPIAPQVWATYCEPADGQERRLATIPIRLPSGG